MFLLDTAASGSVASPGVLPDPALAAVETVPGGRIHGAAGAVPGDRQVLRTRLGLGPRRSHEVALSLLPLEDLAATVGAPLGGVLGLDVLGLGTVWLDLPAGRLVLSTGETQADPDGFVQVPLRRLADELVIVDVRLGDVRVAAVLDLGAAVSIVNTATAGLLLPAPDTTGVHQATAYGADGPGLAAVPYQLGRLSLGGLEMPSLRTYVVDLPVFATLGLQEDPAMLLGLDVVADRTIGIDFVRQRFFLSR